MSANTVVMVLNAKGNRELYCGWRVEEIFRGPWDAAPETIAEAASSALGAPLQVHAQIVWDDGRYVVLRWSTAYAWNARSTPAVLTPLPAATRARDAFSATSDERTGVRARASVGHDSGTFLRDDVARMTARRRLRIA